MKTMTCSQLGGPISCEEEFQADTFEAIAEQSKNHGMEMAQIQDKVHLQVMEKMREGMKDQEAMKKWVAEKKAEFEALPED